MVKNILSVLLFIGLLGCHNSSNPKCQLFKGELYIKLIGVGFNELVTFKGKDSTSIIDKINCKNINELTEEEIKIQNQYNSLVKSNHLNNLTFSFMDYQLDGEISTVYISENEYDQIRKYRLSKLQKLNKKVLIEFYGTRINDHTIICDKLKSVKLKRCKQQWKK